MNEETTIKVRVNDQEVLHELQKHEEGTSREKFCEQAFKVGVLALKSASGQMDIQAIQGATDRHIEKLGATLAVFFDPEGGKFDERVKRLLAEDGELSIALRSSLEGDDSSLGSALKLHREEFSAKIKDEFSLDKKDSALSRLVEEVQNGHNSITGEFSLDDEGSALSRMLRKLKDKLKEDSEARGKFQRDVLAYFENTAGRKDAAKKSTLHGLEFEDRVCKFFEDHCAATGDLGNATGNFTGDIKNCKVGDFVITLGSENKAEGQRIVIEAKEKKGYGMQNAMDEIHTARKNRGAIVGIMVMSKSTKSDDVPRFQRIGNDIFLVWDADDSYSEVFLQAGISVARAIAVDLTASDSEIEFDQEEVMRAVRNIEKEIGYLEDLQKWSQTIQTNSGKILEKIRTMTTNLKREIVTVEDQVRNA